MRGKAISDEVIGKLKLRGKPKCPACGWPGHFVYEGNTGYTQDKCKKCGTRFYINEVTLETREIPRNVG